MSRAEAATTSLAQGAAAHAFREVGPWPGIELTTQDIANLFLVFGGSGMGVIAASERGRLSSAAAIVGIGFFVPAISA